MNDRDYFVAFALNGLLAGRAAPYLSCEAEKYVNAACDIADTMMLRQAGGNVPESEMSTARLVEKLFDRCYSGKAPDRLSEAAAAEIIRLQKCLKEIDKWAQYQGDNLPNCFIFAIDCDDLK